MKNHARAEAVLSTAMMRVIELESKLSAIKLNKVKPRNPVKKFFRIF